MNTEFLESLVKKEDVVKQALTKLYQGVRATNKFLGLKNSPELQSTYYKLRVEEVGELFTAIENEDKVEFLDAVVDGLVVVGYEYFLNYKEPPVEYYSLKTELELEEMVNDLASYYKYEIPYDATLTYLELIFNEINVDHIKAVDEVLSSNWSKFPTKQELKEAYEEYWDEWENDIASSTVIGFQIEEIKQQGRYVNVFHEIRYDESIQEDRIIFWAKGEKQKDGSIKEFPAPKYVKPTATFKEPDFASCWRS